MKAERYSPAWLVAFCCACLIGGLLLAQTSPKSTFKIESETKSEGPDSETTMSDFIVSTSDRNRRELLHKHPDTTAAEYYISPDEKWIYEEARYGTSHDRRSAVRA